MKWLRWYILLMVLILGMYMYAEYKRPPQINWTQTLSSKDKIPYGTYVVHEQLSTFFDTAPQPLNVPVYDHVNNNEDSGDVYLLIANNVITTETDEEELFNYIANGNNVFIASENISQSLEDTLNLSLQPFTVMDYEKDSSSLILVNPAFKDSNHYRMLQRTVDGHFSKFDTAHTEVLGMNSGGKVNFVRIAIGNGYLYLHAAPLAFSNYFILKDNNYKYVQQVFSYLPKHPVALYWDEFYNLGRGGPSTPLRVILSRPALKYAYFTALTAILFYVFFQSKRRQRIIPVVVPPGNATLDFVETVSRVYFNQKNHHNIALKKVTYLLDFIRTNFGLPTQQLDDRFVSLLSAKSGVEIEKTAEIVRQINAIRAAQQINGNELFLFSQQIDEFKKTISRR